MGLAVADGDNKKVVESIREIGEALENDDSVECATKINAILNEDFRIRSNHEYYTERIVMNKLNIKNTDEGNSDKGSIARMVVI